MFVPSVQVYSELTGMQEGKRKKEERKPLERLKIHQKCNFMLFKYMETSYYRRFTFLHNPEYDPV
jgi:hypothetical protein